MAEPARKQPLLLMDITAFTPVLHSLVLAGNMGSQLTLLHLPPLIKDPGGGCHTHPQATKPSVPHTVALVVARALGKVSRAPVADVAAAETTAVAASGRAVATWDLVGGSRVRHLDAPQAVARCVFVAPQLVAAVGEACAVHLWDVRAATAAPAVSIKVARDNLYALAARGGRIFCGGADGAVHHVDLRAQRAHRWSIPGGHGAVLDLSPVEGGVVAIMEAGVVMGVPESGRLPTFVEKVLPFSHRAVADVEETERGLRVAVGSDDGRVQIMEGEPSAWRRREWRVTGTSARVPVVRWAGPAVYACWGEGVYAATE